MNLKYFKMFIDICIKLIDKNYSKLSQKQKRELMLSAHALLDCVTANAIFEDYDDKEN